MKWKLNNTRGVYRYWTSQMDGGVKLRVIFTEAGYTAQAQIDRKRLFASKGSAGTSKQAKQMAERLGKIILEIDNNE